MKILGKPSGDHLEHVADRVCHDSIEVVKDVPCEAFIKMRTATLGYRSPWDKELPGRPYLQLMGECQSIKGDLPYGVTELVFSADDVIPVDYLYEFSDEELKGMIDKGLFSAGFECPDNFINNDFIGMPVTCDIKVVPPLDDKDLPLLIPRVIDARSMVVSAVTCGYTLGNEFKPVVIPEPEVVEEIVFDDLQLPSEMLAESVKAEVLVKDEPVDEDQAEAESDTEKRARELFERINEQVSQEASDPELREAFEAAEKELGESEVDAIEEKPEKASQARIAADSEKMVDGFVPLSLDDISDDREVE